MIEFDLIAHICDISLGRSSWEEVLERVRARFATEASLLVEYGAGHQDARSLSRIDGDGRPWDEYASYYASIDPFAAAMRLGVIRAGVVVADRHVVQEKEFCASEYYNDWFRPNRIRYTAGAYVRKRDGCFLQLGMPRAPDAGPYDERELVELQHYFNHICRAVLIADALACKKRQPDLDLLARTHGLTPAETRLVEKLMETGSLKRAAESSKRSYFTLRAQLRAIFEKTGAHSQPELIRLVHNGVEGAETARKRR